MKQILGYAVIGILTAGVIMAVFTGAYGVLWSDDLKKFSQYIDKDNFHDWKFLETIDLEPRGSLKFRKGASELMGPYRLDFDEYPGVSRVDLIMDANLGAFDIEFVENPDMIYSFTMETGKGNEEPEITVYQEGDTLKVDIQIEMEEVNNVGRFEDGFDDRRVKLSLSRDMLYNVDIKSGVGEMQYKMSDGAEVENLKLETDVGKVDLRLERAAKVGVITVDTNVGLIETDIRDSSFEELNMKSKVGKVSLRLEEPRLVGGTTVALESELGEVTSRVILDDYTEARVSGDANIGGANADVEEDFSITHSSMDSFVVESGGYPGTANLKMTMTTNAGSVELEIGR